MLQYGAWEIDKLKFDKFITPNFLNKCIDDFNGFYIGHHKTHKLTWAYGLGNIEISYLYLKKPYQSVSTLVQYCILLNLEKYGEKTISELSELLGHYLAIVTNEANALLYHMSYNPKRALTAGIISSDSKDNLDLKPENKIKINRDFQANTLRINTIPAVFRVKYYLIILIIYNRNQQVKRKNKKRLMLIKLEFIEMLL